MSRAKVVLQRERKKRTEFGHPWVYASEIEHVLPGADGLPDRGALVDVVNHKQQLLGVGYYNAQSQITVRLVSNQRMADLAELDVDWFVAKFEACLAFRTRFVKDEDCRLVYGEADGVPGLIVDRFEQVLVVQLLTAGVDVRRNTIVEALVRVFAPRGIYERSDVSVRELEGLEQRVGVLYGDCPRIRMIQENGLKMEVDIESGQKTGYFYDQRENRAALQQLVTGYGARSGIRRDEAGVVRNSSGKEVSFPYWDGATVLECFAHSGSFTLHACKYGAKRVTCLDISEHAIDTARRNVERNGFSDRVEFVVDDAFDYLRRNVRGNEQKRAYGAAMQLGGRAQSTVNQGERPSDGRTWDVVILDPPAFTKSRSSVPGAVRGYKEINLQAMKLVNEGGFLVTASCSYHMKPELFLETIQAAADDAGKRLRLIEWRGAGKDHPQVLGVSEAHYLKFAIFEVTRR